MKILEQSIEEIYKYYKKNISLLPKGLELTGKATIFIFTSITLLVIDLFMITAIILAIGKLVEYYILP